MRRVDRRDWPDADALARMRAALGLTQLAKQLRVSRSALTYYLNEIDGRDSLRQAIKADEKFAKRMRAAIAAGDENAASASASAVKPSPWRPKRVSAIAPRSYCGSSAWAVTEG